MSAPTVDIPRESTDWVEVAITLTSDGSPVSSAAVQFAVLPIGVHPGVGDWSAPFADPDLSGAVGVFLGPVTASGRYGIWAKVTDTPLIPVLNPAVVGWINRT